MKKETIGILIVSLILVVGGMFALWITTAPANADDWVNVEPITEDTVLEITINHTGNATVIPVLDYVNWGYGSPPFFHISSQDMLDHFEKVYLAVQYIQRPITIIDEMNRTKKIAVTVVLEIWLFSLDGCAYFFNLYDTISAIPTMDADHITFDAVQSADQTTYTFHYPKIIGWEDP